jgi:integrase
MTIAIEIETGPKIRPPLAPETQRLYAGDWAAFADWCAAAGRSRLPADPATVATFLESLSGSHRYGALARRLAAIADRHARAGMPVPAIHPRLTALLRHLRARPPRARKAPPSPDQLTRLARACLGDRTGQRDRALLLLMAAGLSRTTLIGLDAEDVRLTTPGMDLTLCGHGFDGAEAAPTRVVTLARHSLPPACPVRALEDWMRASETAFGPVFRKVDRWGNVEHHRLGVDAIRRILQRAVKRSRGLSAPRRPRGGKGVRPVGSEVQPAEARPAEAERP